MTPAVDLAAHGRRLLLGEGCAQDLPTALAALNAAADGGAADAARSLAICAAFGVGGPRNLARALDWLTRAAALGCRRSRAELGVLAERAGAPDGRVDVAVLAALAASPAPGRRLPVRPVVVALDAFLNAAECALLIDCARDHLERALVYRGASTPQRADSRTNSECALTLPHASVLLAITRARIAATLGVHVAHFEVTKLLHYAPGERFALHGDFLQATTPDLARELEARGQRTATLLVYLNDDYAGGETEFPRLGLRHRGRAGDALLFANVDATGAPDLDTLHAGLPTTRGEKWLLSQWIRARPVEA